MELWFFAATLIGLIHVSTTETCDQCTSQYEGDTTTESCQKFKNYMSCLENTISTGSCSLPTVKAKSLGDKYETIKDSCDITETCECQVEYWKTSSSTNETAECSADKAFFACMKGKTDNSCADRTHYALVTNHSFVSSCPSDTCKCLITYLETDTDTGDMCVASKSFIDCMKGKTSTSCDDLVAAHQETITPPDDCIQTDSACYCEKVYAETNVTTTDKKCKADTDFFVCMKDKSNPSCNGQAPSQLVTGHSYDENCPSSTCKCFIDYLKRDITGNEKCLAQKAFITCMKGKTELQCDGTTKANDKTGFPEIDPTCIGDKETEACGCDQEYAETDITEDKCTADLTYVMCLKGKTTAVCDGRAAKDVASMHEITCTADLNDTCLCEIAQAKRNVVADHKCQSFKSFITCLRTATKSSCDKSKTAAEVAASAKQVLDTCEDKTKTCDCEITYAVEETKCDASKNLIHCLRAETSTGCLDTTNVTFLVDQAATVENCDKSALCQCEIDYAKGGKSQSSEHCRIAKSLFACLYETADDITTCNGETKADLKSFAKEQITSTIPDCSLDDTCICEEMSLQETCNDRKATISCLQTATSKGCNGVKTVEAIAAQTVAAIDSTCVPADSFCQCEMSYAVAAKTSSEEQCKADTDFFSCANSKSGLSCSNQTVSQMVTAHAYDEECPTATCKCLIDYLKMNITESNKCTTQKTFITCMKGKTDLQCDGQKKANDDTGFPQLTTECIGDKATETCGCEKEYVLADLTADKCTADREFFMCLKGKTTVACDGRAAHVVASTHIVAETCLSSLSDTCRCEVELTKRNTAGDNKCGAYQAFISCLKTATGRSCDNQSSASEVVASVLPVLDDCDPSPTCKCEMSYAANNRVAEDSKCQANKALVACLRNETSPGCVETTTVSSLIDIAAATVPNCELSNLCKCEIEYSKGEKVSSISHCSNAKSLLACLYDEDDTEKTCNDGSKTDFEIFVKTLINSTITDCSFDDTCKCEEIMSDGTCSDLKKGISCLKTATSKGCNGVKTVKSLAEETAKKITALGDCTLSPGCTCELNYTSADVSTDARKCTEAKSLKTCLSNAISAAKGAEIKGCDDTTLAKDIVTDVAEKIVTATCGAVQNSAMSLGLLIVVTLIVNIFKP